MTITERALCETVIDIGQLTPAEKRELSRAVKKGVLIKGKGGPFPAIKTAYAAPDYGLEGERRACVAKMMALCYLDEIAAKRREEEVTYGKNR